MKVFVTGGNGFIGQVVVKTLIKHGHEVLALAHSDHSAQQLTQAGATPVKGSLNDLDTLSTAAKSSDGVIHLAFTNDFNHYDEAVAKDMAAVKALGDALANTDKPLVNTSGTLMAVGMGRTATEQDHMAHPVGRAASEALALSYAQQGVRASVVRLAPTVHDVQRQGFGSILAQMAVNQGKIGYVGDGANVWPSVHRNDAAQLFVAALENGEAGATYNAVAEEGVPVKTIVETIGNTLRVPVEHFDEETAKAYFGWFEPTVVGSNPTSSTWTQAALDWHPRETGLLDDLKTCLSNPANVAALQQPRN
ncbi:Epimerase-dehydratase [Furfurilactobacillus rossiae]|uniref:SDR family oxidoreductase n=1 Tax=Furfurilactobacillus rossiae TaxID=231049 RepID=UPI0015BDEF38|nr:SDR family oxidoreductase [Furfurilactobacillus rossiae]MCF6164452.1 SDR family oxidoreductase [Furfurilactobacillus rossiae]QLE64736.1 Epimerase-dehydratase [Furfurilactobacillus rossiae]